MGVEQSNTSIVYGTRLILKLFRQIATGASIPDLEIARHLTERTQIRPASRRRRRIRICARPGNAPRHRRDACSSSSPARATRWSPCTRCGAADFCEQVARHRRRRTVRGCWRGRFDADPLAPIENATAGLSRAARATLGRRNGAEMHWRSRRTPRTRRFRPNHASCADLEQLAEETSRQARQVLDAVTSLRTGTHRRGQVACGSAPAIEEYAGGTNSDHSAGRGGDEDPCARRLPSRASALVRE